MAKRTPPATANPRLTPSDSLQALGGALDAAIGALRAADDPCERASALAGALRLLWPSCPLWACLLRAGGTAYLSVVDGEGQFQAVEAPALPSAPVGHRWITEPIPGEGQDHGTLAVAGLSTSLENDPLLRVCAGQLGLWLDLEAQRREGVRLRAALAEQVWLANLGALTSPLTHEFNNFLNVLLLQIAVLEHELPEKRRGDFRAIRQQGKNVAELVRQWQQYRSRQQAPPEPLDLNQVVGEAVEALCGEEPGFGEPALRLLPPGAEAPPGEGVWVRLALDGGTPPILGSRLDLQRLVRFLVGSAAAAVTSARGLVVVTTTTAGEGVRLRVEDSGTAVAPALLAELFEPLVVAREGPNRLELAACKIIAQRRLQGTIEAANRPEGGVAVEVTLRIAR